MKRLSRAEFESRFVRRPAVTEFDGLYGDLHVDCDATVSGAVEGSLYVLGNAHVLVSVRVDGCAHVAPEAVLWLEGLIDGRVYVDGAALLNGACGSASGSRVSIVHEPCEPADSETGAVPDAAAR